MIMNTIMAPVLWVTLLNISDHCKHLKRLVLAGLFFLYKKTLKRKYILSESLCKFFSMFLFCGVCFAAYIIGN